MKPFFSLNIDALGFCISLMCGVHCLLTFIIILIVPALAISFLETKTFELTIIGLSLFLACGPQIRSYVLIHKNSLPLFLVFGGMNLLLISPFLSGELLEISCSILGGGFIALSHVKNWKLCKTNLQNHAK